MLKDNLLKTRVSTLASLRHASSPPTQSFDGGDGGGTTTSANRYGWRSGVCGGVAHVERGRPRDVRRWRLLVAAMQLRLCLDASAANGEEILLWMIVFKTSSSPLRSQPTRPAADLKFLLSNDASKWIVTLAIFPDRNFVSSAHSLAHPFLEKSLCCPYTLPSK
ncbi:uncharacterized protein LOC128042553 [Gossypium raimondii]|uniref:uncharacterized protein LOC128042553 n=1 Tax=Gossypium raimondii TaxID=29730 RepID=UPI00227C967E|nr:uncharacterized protein LOC128042553 [Gossypium raimondii]